MNWQFANDRPIYIQIVEQVQMGILNGEYPPGGAMPSVRTLAVEAEVNPNTMQKALAELEQQGLIHTKRTTGRTVTEDETMIEKLKESMAKEHIRKFIESMAGLGIDKQQAVNMLKEEAN